MELAQEQPIKGYFQKCGDALVSCDHSMLALNCCFCMAVFVQLDTFRKHILEIHTDELAERFDLNTVDSGCEEVCEVKDTDCADDVEMFIAEECIVDGTMEHSAGMQDIAKELLEFADKEEENNALDVEHLNGVTKNSVSSSVMENGKSSTFGVINENNASFAVAKYSDDEVEKSVDSCSVYLDTNGDSTSAMDIFKPNYVTDLHLLKLYEQQACLWNLQHSKFNNKPARSLAFMHILTELKRLVHVSERSKLKINKLRMRIAQLCDWYKAQLRTRFRCKMLGKIFELNEEELLFKQFEFLQTTFEPSIEKEEEFKIRDELEAQYLCQDEIFSNEESDDKSLEGSSTKMLCQGSSDVEEHAAEVKETTLNISCTTQERIETTRLIEAYRKFPILWNPHASESNQFKAKRKAFENIAKILSYEYLMPMSSELVRQKIKNLRQQYKDYLKKKENGINSKLWYIPLLASFLKEHINTSLRKGNAKELVKKMPASLDLPFRFEANMPLNLHLIDVLYNSPSIWQSKNLAFQVSTKLLENIALKEMLQELNTAHGLQLDENNLLLLLHDLCEWFKREKTRQHYCNEQETDTQSEFVPSAAACWEKMQFLANYTFLPDAYTCVVCNKTTNSIHAYLIDRCRHASLPPHKCFYCDKRFVDITNCRTHECRIHSKILNYTCKYCDKKFAHATDELLHRRRFHTQERPFICEICGKSFVASHEMKRHRNWHLQKQDYKCKICDISFYVRSELHLHKLRKHPPAESNKICKMCGRGFQTAWKLKKHLLVRCKQENERLTISLLKHKVQTRHNKPVMEALDERSFISAEESAVNPNNEKSPPNELF